MQPPDVINCLIVDDEPPALDILKTYIHALSRLQLVEACNLKAVNKVMNVSLSDVKHAVAPGYTGTLYQSAFICFRADRKMHKVALDDILYVESLKDYIKVATSTKTIVTRQSISSLEENLPKSMFLRIHRSYIVAINKIQSYSSELVTIGANELPVSKMYKHEVENILG